MTASSPIEPVIERLRTYVTEYEDAWNWGGPSIYPDRPELADIKAVIEALTLSREPTDPIEQVTAEMLEAACEIDAWRGDEWIHADKLPEIYLAMRQHDRTLSREPTERMRAERGRIIRQADERGDFVTGDDGLVVYWPDNSNGVLNEWVLRTLADELERRNAATRAHLDLAMESQ